MKNYLKYILIIFILVLTSCKNEKKEVSVIEETSIDLQMIQAYNEGLKNLELGDAIVAAKKFNEAEILFPQSEWAPKAALMAAYAYYSQDYYGDSIAELERFLKVYPRHKNKDYAYYLLAISYYEQIVDETKDLESILQARNYFNIIVRDFPNTEYAMDAEFKLDLIEDILAAKEMYIGRYYVQKKKWIPAINRFRAIIDDYETTIYTEEALHRLVEVYYIIGLEEEAKKYAKILGYNYQSSQWYEKSYGVFNEMYEKNKKEIEKKNKKSRSILKKIKSLFG